MKKIIKIGLIVLIFFCLAMDLFGYSDFQPEQVQPAPTSSSVNMNQIFAYRSTSFKGYFLSCHGKPILEYQTRGPIEKEEYQDSEYYAFYPKTNLIAGEVVKSGFDVTCNFGLIFLDPNLSFHLFSNAYYPQRYSIDSKVYSDDQFDEILAKLNPEFKKR